MAGLCLHWIPLPFEHVVSGHLLAVPTGWLVRNSISRWLWTKAPVFPPESFSFLFTLHRVSVYYKHPAPWPRGFWCSPRPLLPCCDSGPSSSFHRVLKWSLLAPLDKTFAHTLRHCLSPLPASNSSKREFFLLPWLITKVRGFHLMVHMCGYHSEVTHALQALNYSYSHWPDCLFCQAVTQWINMLAVWGWELFLFVQ